MDDTINRAVEISVVVPVFNESEGLDVFFREVISVLSGITDRFEILCVDDGSTDDTYARVFAMHARDSRVRIVRLSRNFGKENALSAGLDLAVGAAVIPIDADLQDPPEVIPQLVAKWREGYDVVLARRISRDGEGLFKRATAGAFYKLLSRISPTEIPANVGDFRLMDRRVVEALGQLPERTRFMKGIFAWLGFHQATVEYNRPTRTGGKPKQSWGRLFALALDGIISFSALPLKIWTYFGLVVAVGAVVYALFIIVHTLTSGNDLPGYPSLIVVILFMNGLLLTGIGVIGEYLARVFVEVKQRPIYIISSHAGVASLDAQAAQSGNSVNQDSDVRQPRGQGEYGPEDFADARRLIENAK